MAYPSPRQVVGLVLFFPALVVAVIGVGGYDFALKLMGRKGRG
ncbi:MAG TPA: hypothetical protein VGK73_34900 [Polyangiaceae bacterium]